MRTEDTELVLNFYLGSGTDHKGRKLSQVVQKSDRWLEETHDYIQWCSVEKLGECDSTLTIKGIGEHLEGGFFEKIGGLAGQES